jgi:hypothetical protein
MAAWNVCKIRVVTGILALQAGKIGMYEPKKKDWIGVSALDS